MPGCVTIPTSSCPKGRKEIEAFDRGARGYRDVCLFVRTNILYDVKNKMNSHFWNHCVVVDEPPEVGNGRIAVNVYTYGEITRIPKVGDAVGGGVLAQFLWLCIGPADVQILPRNPVRLLFKGPSSWGWVVRVCRPDSRYTSCSPARCKGASRCTAQTKAASVTSPSA